ncbi:MAG: hypothetical protein QF780_04880, partial [Candidatus Marinimicrobia bacterium]|nr:hypothetical protein [Candidatus Neomarinimicrobiota bacterium]
MFHKPILIIVLSVISLVTFSCSNNNEAMTYHFSKEEMSELNKSGKVVKLNERGVERVFIYDDKYSKQQTDAAPKILARDKAVE